MIIADTGFWLALANRRDSHHLAAIDALKNIDEPLITTWPVLTETCHLLTHRLGALAQIRFMESWTQKAFRVHEFGEADVSRVLALVKHYQNLPMDLADASLVVLADHLGHGRILSTDERDFQTYRWKRRQPFENLLPLQEASQMRRDPR